MDDDQELQDHVVTITFTLLIEDVTAKMRDEFIDRLTDPGNEIEFRLSDGLDYVATVQQLDYKGVVE